MTAQRQILQQKTKEIEEIGQIMQQYKVMALAGLTKVRAAQLQQLRKKLHGNAYLRVIKNSLIKRAIAQAEEKPGLEKLEDHLAGSTILLFTNLNPFKLVTLLEKSKVTVTAKAGDVAAFDVVVPAGNTGQAPGPIISQLSAVGLKTRIESGSVWISKETLVVKEGEAISDRLAAVLSKLGIRPVEAGLELKAVYDEGMIIAGEDLLLDINATRKTIEEAHRAAFYLSIKTAYTMPENIVFLLRQANEDAYTLCISQNIPTKETIADILKKASSQAATLKSRLEMVKQTAQKG